MVKMSQKLLGLFLISSLFVVHPTYSADWPIHKVAEKVPGSSQKAALAGAVLLGAVAYQWSTSEEGSALQTLQALKEYALKTPELKWRKRATAASLALLYAAHRYCKSKPVSAVAALASSIPLYSIYKDMLLVRDVQLAKAGKEVDDEHIIKYMDSLCFNRKGERRRYFCEDEGGQRYNPVHFKVKFNDYCRLFPPVETPKRLQEVFFMHYKEEKNRGQLRRCAQQLLQAKGFVGEKREVETSDELIQRRHHNKWIMPLKLLYKNVGRGSVDCSAIEYEVYDFDLPFDSDNWYEKWCSYKDSYECIFAAQKGVMTKCASRKLAS